MTALIGGSLLLIAGSAIALVIGWTSADESLIWTSIAASVAAAVMLSLGYYRSRAEATKRPAGGAPRQAPPPAGAPAKASAAAAAADAVPAVRAEPLPTQETPAVAPAAGETVVAYPDRSRFHRPDCRYASLPGGEKIAREAAVRRGYDPCGVCNP